MNRKIVIYLFILILTLVTTACSQEEAIVKEEGIPVATMELKPMTLVDKETFAGTVTSAKEVMVSTKIPGKIGEIYVQVGDKVEAGDLLFELENDDLKATVEQAEQNLLMARANLANIKKGARTQEIEQATEAVNQAKVKLEIAKTNYEKIKELYDVDAIPKQKYDQAVSELKIAESAYKSALEKLSLVKEGATEEMIEAAQSQVGLAEANLSMAKAKLSDTIIIAPIGGEIGFLKFETGEFVMQGTPVIQIVDNQHMIVELDVSENVISKINLDDQVNIKIEAIESKSFKGKITEISPSADQRSKVYPIKIQILEPDERMKSGMTASIIIDLESKENILAVPTDSIVEEAGQTYVYLVKDSRAVKTQIEKGIKEGKLVEVKDGLQEKEILIIAGQNKVKDGVLVNEGGEGL